MPNTFRKNILIGFGFSILLLLLSSIASFVSIRALLTSASQVDHTNQVISELENINGLLLEAESGQRGYLFTGDNTFLESVQITHTILRERILAVKKLMADNPLQIQRVDTLHRYIESRLSALNNGIRLKRDGREITNEMMLTGKRYSDNAKRVILDIQNTEKGLLMQRNTRMEQFSNFTPFLIALAAVISLMITLVFYGKIIADYRQRNLLQEELLAKDADVNSRLLIIKNIAERISNGDYAVRVEHEKNDLMGGLASSLNKMGESLQYSFETLEEKEWLQSGLASMNQQMIGEKDMDALCDTILHFVANYSGSRVGALYLFEDNSETLFLNSKFGLTGNVPQRILPGEGIVGQCAKELAIVQVDGIAEDHFTISFAAGNLKPSSIIALPLFYGGALTGVLELGSLSLYTKRELAFFREASESVGKAIFVAQARRRMQELLEETQSQAEELKAQQLELENSNEELRAQKERLQVSEEELKVQQEELMQANTELEERTTMLEEKNQMIGEKNELIQKKANELALSTKYKSEFLANMSHELRTPLNSILLLSRLMMENGTRNLTDEQIEYSKVIQSSGQGLLSLIDEILDLSKIEAGKMDVEYRQVGIQDIADDIRNVFEVQAREKKLDFSIEIADSMPATIETDRMRLDQILKNLISNALKFTSKGFLKVEIYPSSSGMIVFSVKDTGIGIALEKQEQIFEAFQQADGSTRRQYGGTGLGLSISRQLAHLLGGSIELSSEPGKGSEFRLFVPVTKPDVLPVTAFSQSVIAEEILNEYKADLHQKEKLANTPGKDRVLVTEDDTPDKMSEVFQRIEHVLRNEPRKALIVEENPVHAKALASFLDNHNIQSEIQIRVNDAIDALLQKDGCCVILDKGISDEQSYKDLERIRQTPGLEHLPIIIFTGKSISPMQEGRIKQFANSIVIKTANSYQRILDEVSLFLHVVHEQKKTTSAGFSIERLGRATEVLKDKKVLIADDDVRNIFSLSKSLESVGMNVISAMDGKEALAKIGEHPNVDIVLMDMMMPEMDGYEAMRSIRNIPGYSKLPIIAVTAKAMMGDREKCISSGASDYITKPIDKDQLVSLLRVWLYDRNMS